MFAITGIWSIKWSIVPTLTLSVFDCVVFKIPEVYGHIAITADEWLVLDLIDVNVCSNTLITLYCVYQSGTCMTLPAP